MPGLVPCFCFVGFIIFFVSLRIDLKQHAGKVCIWELEMPLVIELVECRTERVVVFQMKVVHFGFRCSEATIFTHIHLWPSLLVIILMSHAMNFEAVRFQRAPLCKRFFAKITSIRTNTCMCSCVPFQIKGIIKPFTAKCTKITFGIRVALHMSIQQPLKAKHFCTHSALKLGGIRFWS
jgi:hypothetical protein